VAPANPNPAAALSNPAARIALKPTMMLNYFTNLKETEDFSSNPEKEEALDIIIDRITYDEDGTTPFGDLLSREKKEIQKNMRVILVTRIPEVDRLGRYGEKLLEKWLNCSNIHRTFMFIDKPTMRQIVLRNRGEDIATNLSVEKWLKI